MKDIINAFGHGMKLKVFLIKNVPMFHNKYALNFVARTLTFSQEKSEISIPSAISQFSLR